MSRWILDTDHVSLWQREHPQVKQRLGNIELAEFAVTLITVEEQLRGRLDSIRRASSEAAITATYSNLKETYLFFLNINLLDFDNLAYSQFMDLRRQGIRIGTQDLRIASIALSVGGIVVTRNRRDFERVPGLMIEDWTIAH
jgi:tRNA(fMet)-specific endonuclease VapC